ncbi:hypothetical protein [Schaalia sp. 19OD2882]|uniref:hypothetical protein n=1 Tax=Schaalia sp. 19OD2882 TaxID=2794089 RepID=UPI001C1EFAE1|nr:hypothetical protein [Schaalia sp. 19OD2882]
MTCAIGFLNAPAGEVALALQGFIDRLPTLAKGRVAPVSGSLEQCLLQLQPLTIGYRPRILLAPTRAPGWTAIFDAHALGQGVGDRTAMLAGTIMKTRGYFFCSIRPKKEAPGQLGGCQFRVLGPEEFLGFVRSVDLIENTPGHWYFEAGGPVQSFEDEAAYRRRRKSERLTQQMLVDYAAAVGLRPWEEDFYTGPYWIASNDLTATAKCSYTLEQARQRLGLPTE